MHTHPRKGRNHFRMIFLCLGVMIFIIGVFSFFDLSSTPFAWLLLLLCPLMHFFMMKKHGAQH